MFSPEKKAAPPPLKPEAPKQKGDFGSSEEAKKFYADVAAKNERRAQEDLGGEMAKDIETSQQTKTEKAERVAEMNATLHSLEVQKQGAQKDLEAALNMLSEIAAGKQVNIHDLYSKTAGRSPEPISFQGTSGKYAEEAVRLAEANIARISKEMNNVQDQSRKG